MDPAGSGCFKYDALQYCWFLYISFVVPLCSFLFSFISFCLGRFFFNFHVKNLSLCLLSAYSQRKLFYGARFEEFDTDFRCKTLSTPTCGRVSVPAKYLILGVNSWFDLQQILDTCAFFCQSSVEKSLYSHLNLLPYLRFLMEFVALRKGSRACYESCVPEIRKTTAVHFNGCEDNSLNFNAQFQGNHFLKENFEDPAASLFLMPCFVSPKVPSFSCSGNCVSGELGRDFSKSMDLRSKKQVQIVQIQIIQ